jgi:hypothetical protein
MFLNNYYILSDFLSLKVTVKKSVYLQKCKCLLKLRYNYDRYFLTAAFEPQNADVTDMANKHVT